MADETTKADETVDAPADVDTRDVTPTELPAGDTEDAPAAAAAVPPHAADEPARTQAEEAEAPDADAAPRDAEAETGSRTPSVADARRQKKRLARAVRQRRSRARTETPTERKPIARVPKPETERGRRQERRGVVVSDAMDKTIVVKVDVTKVHPRYKKVIRRSTKFHAHDDRNVAKIGDVVRIVETRPLSATKRWRLAEILEEAK
jgi:small subunit ribosomal protein S17